MRILNDVETWGAWSDSRVAGLERWIYDHAVLGDGVANGAGVSYGSLVLMSDMVISIDCLR